MFGAPPPGTFGAPARSAAADVDSSSFATFGAPPQESFVAPPPGRSAGSGGTPTAASGAERPPSSMFDAPPPPPQATFGAAPEPPPMSASGGSRPPDPFGSARDTGGAWGGNGVEDETLSAADFFGSTTTEYDVFGGDSAGRADPFGGAEARPDDSRAVDAPDAGGTAGSWPGEQRDESGVAAATFGSPPGEGFGGGGAGEGESSAWWESEIGDDDTRDAEVDTSNTVGGTAATAERGSSEDGPAAGMHEAFRNSTMDEQRMDAPSSSAPGTAKYEDLGAPPADVFGPAAPAHAADTEVEAQKQGAPQPGQPPRPRALSKGPLRTGRSASPVPFPRQQQSPHGVKVDGGDVEGAGSPGGPGNDGSSAGVGLWAPGADARTDRTASPGWEKQPSPPLELGVFGAPPPPPEDSRSAPARTAADLFGAAAGDESFAGDGGEWGMSAADPEGASESSESDQFAGDASAVVSGSTAPVRRKPPRVEVGVPTHPRSSFVASGGGSSAAVAALGLGTAPSSPPRLFASRSSSWAERNSEPAEEKSGYEGMFAPSPEVSPCRQEENEDDEEEEEENGPAAAAVVGSSASLAMEEVMSLLPTAEISRASAFPDVGGGSTKYSQGPSFSPIPEAADTQSPPRLGGGPPVERSEEGSAPGVVSRDSYARDGINEPAAATQDGGGRAGPGSTLSTPFGAWSRGSAMTPEVAEGFPSSEDGGGALDSSGRPPSVEEDGTPDSAESPGLSSQIFQPVVDSAVVPSAVGNGGGTAEVPPPPPAAVGGEKDDEGGANEVISSLPGMVEGKEDEQPRWPAPQAAADPPSSSFSLGEGAQKVDGDDTAGDGDGWSEDDWGVDDDDAAPDDGGVRNPSGNGGAGQETTGVAADTVRDEPVGDATGGGGGGGESNTHLFSSDSSDGDESWGGGEEGGGESEVTDEEESGSGSESDEDGSIGDADHSNDVSIAETTANDFFAVR